MKEQDMEILKNAGIDPESAIERFMGNEALYLKFLFRFPDDENYQNLCRFIEQQDCKNAFTTAHTLKGVCGNLSIKRMETILSEQVEYLRNGDLQKGRDMMPQLEEVYDRVKEAINELREDS